MDQAGAFQLQKVATVQASCEVSLEIVKKQKPKTTGGNTHQTLYSSNCRTHIWEGEGSQN